MRLTCDILHCGARAACGSTYSYTMQTLFRHYFSKQRQIFRESATTLINVNLMISRRKTALLHLQTRCCHCSARFISYFCKKKNVRFEQNITYPSSEKWEGKIEIVKIPDANTDARKASPKPAIPKSKLTDMLLTLFPSSA